MCDASLREELDGLASRRERLTAALALAASHLEATGSAPGDDLLHDLREFQQRLQQACRRVTESVKSPRLPLRSDGRLALDDLERAVDFLQEVEQVRETLHGILALQHTENADFAPLSRCQSDARQLLEKLQDEMPSLPDTVQSMVNGEHPLASVAALAGTMEQLTDDEWSAHQATVSQTYGRSLGTAFARGRIVGQRDQCRTVPVAEMLQPVQRDVLPTLARSLLAATDANRLQRREALLLELLRQRRFAIAAHLTTAWSGPGDFPAPQLLRCLALVQHLGYSRGDLARRIELELRQLKSVDAHRHHSAAPWFVRSATLVPALLGASPTATRLQRAFGIEPGLGQLFNYSTRVATFGERLAGKASELFQIPRDEAQQSQERDHLQRDIERWQSESVKRAATYARSSQLFLHAHWTVLACPARRHAQAVHEWAKWQDVLTLAHRLVRPARDGAEGERNWVQREIARLASLVKSAERAAAAPDADTSHPSGWDADMRSTLMAAIDLANRWLRLQASEPSRSRLFAPQADELRLELLERTPAVLSELAQMEHTTSSPLVHCGVDCCRSAVLRIRDLCAGQTALPIQEPEATRVLAGELLQLPKSAFNDRGDPLGDPRQWERSLLLFLSGGTEDMRSEAQEVPADSPEPAISDTAAVGATSAAMATWVF